MAVGLENPLPVILGVIGVAGAACVGFGVAVGYGMGSGEDSTLATTKLSPARVQILDAGLAGNRSDLDKALTDAVNTYFSDKGLKCDPVDASSTVGETMRLAQANCPKP